MCLSYVSVIFVCMLNFSTTLNIGMVRISGIGVRTYIEFVISGQMSNIWPNIRLTTRYLAKNPAEYRISNLIYPLNMNFIPFPSLVMFRRRLGRVKSWWETTAMKGTARLVNYNSCT